jgi:hypothetical protein
VLGTGFGAVDLGDLAAAGEISSCAPRSGKFYPEDPISLDAIKTEQADLDYGVKQVPPSPLARTCTADRSRPRG